MVTKCEDWTMLDSTYVLLRATMFSLLLLYFHYYDIHINLWLHSL